MKTTNKDKMVFARVDEAMHTRLERLSELSYRPVSQIIRDAIRRELERLESVNGRPRKSK